MGHPTISAQILQHFPASNSTFSGLQCGQFSISYVFFQSKHAGVTTSKISDDIVWTSLKRGEGRCWRDEIRSAQYWAATDPQPSQTCASWAIQDIVLILKLTLKDFFNF